MAYNLHRPFYLLGTQTGEFFRSVVELTLFLFVAYMILIEYKNDRRLELKYLLYAFIAMAISKLILCFVIGGVLFLGFPEHWNTIYLPVIEHGAETFAIISLANAFIFALLKNKIIKKQMVWQTNLLIVVFTVSVISWFWDALNNPVMEYSMHWSHLLFTIIKIIFLIYPVAVFMLSSGIRFKHKLGLNIAFLLYLVGPVLTLLNIIFFNGTDARFDVAAFPFPLMAVGMFARVIYLRLVDKAYLKQMLKASEEKYKKEKELSEMKDKFVSTVSHELRTPLTSINLYASLLKNNEFGKMNKKQKEATGIIKDEAARLSNLINDILDLSKMEAKKVSVSISDFDLSYFMKNNPCIALAAEKKIKIINKIPNKMIIKADNEKIRQVLINLMSNAIKYTDSGGKITVSAEKKNGKVEISVADTGIGIPPDKLEKIFEKFYQVEEHMTRKQGGTGLGLTIANEIVKLHGGEIKVESEVGKGSTFTVVLPQ